MKILICVDVQEGFCETLQTREIAKKIVELTHRNIFDYVIATKFVNRNSAFKNILNWQRLKNDEETKFVEGLRYDLIETKYRYTCVDSKFVSILKNINNGKIPNEIYICGLDTDCCVYKIAIDLFERDIKPIVIEDYCQSSCGQEFHNAGLTVLRKNIGEDQVKKLNEITFKDVPKKLSCC